MVKEITLYNEEKTVTFNKFFWEKWTATCKRIKLEHSLTPCPKINSKWIKDLNGKPDTLNFLEEMIGKTLFDINHSTLFFFFCGGGEGGFPLLKQRKAKQK